jgi:hypothetical protein
MNRFVSLSPPRGRALLALLGALAAPAASAADAPLAPARQYQVRGTGSATVSGSRCCGDTRFTGRFEAAYEIDPSGAARMTALRVALDDIDVLVHDGFLGLFSQHVEVRCASAGNAGVAAGALADPTHVKFPPGALALAGVSSEGRLGDGSCAAPTISFSSLNDVEVQVLHDPAADVFGLTGTFGTAIAGETFSLALRLDGRFVNRPPQASLALRRLGEPWPQGGCPAFWRWNGQLWELVAEANTPAGLKGDLHSFSSDPDAAGWAQGDVFAERFFDTRSTTGTRVFLGQGRDVTALTFEFGPQHRVELLAVDHAGASSATACTFRVIDTRPPTVTPPAPVTLNCSTTGGVTRATSAPLRAFLGGATASDATDPAPVALAPTLGGAAITDTTLFPADGAARSVTFGYRDRWGHTGSGASTVTVRDTTPPAGSATATPSLLGATNKWWWIATSVPAWDNCGGAVTLRLISITSTVPAWDAADVLSASLGTADFGFYIFTRVATPGVPRVWTITYEAKDAAGNVAYLKAKVTVG